MLNLILSLLILEIFTFVQPNSQKKVTSISYGHYSGFCSGYCSKVVKIDEKKTITSEIWQSGKAKLPLSPNKVDTTCTDTAYWNLLLSKLNIEAFTKLPYQNGCPGCDDGAEEWIEISINGENRKVTFEYGMEIEGLMPLLNDFRKKD
jgi:hypothetical protein